MLTARGLSADKLEGFAIGADDYIVKPFDTPELLARIRGVLRRSRDMRAQSPLTGLPGNVRIEEEIDARVDQRTPFAILYADLDHFKAFNDHYGFMRGDQVIQTTARLIEEVARECHRRRRVRRPRRRRRLRGRGRPRRRRRSSPRASSSASTRCARRPLRRRRTASAGYVEVTNRRGELQRFPMLTVSIGVATTEHAELPALRRGRGRGDRDEAVHEGRHRLLVGDRPPRDLGGRPRAWRLSEGRVRPGRSPVRSVTPRSQQRREFVGASRCPRPPSCMSISSAKETSAVAERPLARGRCRCPG